MTPPRFELGTRVAPACYRYTTGGTPYPVQWPNGTRSTVVIQRRRFRPAKNWDLRGADGTDAESIRHQPPNASSNRAVPGPIAGPGEAKPTTNAVRHWVVSSNAFGRGHGWIARNDVSLTVPFGGIHIILVQARYHIPCRGTLPDESITDRLDRFRIDLLVDGQKYHRGRQPVGSFVRCILSNVGR